LDGLSPFWVAASFRRLPPTDDKRRDPLQRRSHIELEEYGIGMHATSKRLTILHVATINKPITSQIRYDDPIAYRPLAFQSMKNAFDSKEKNSGSYPGTAVSSTIS